MTRRAHARPDKGDQYEAKEYEVVASTAVLGHQPGERFHAVLTGSSLLLVGSHVREVQTKSGGDRRKEE